jgi:hypothetical protein
VAGVREDSGLGRFPDLQAGEELSEEESWFTERGDGDTVSIDTVSIDTDSIDITAPAQRKSA